MSALQHVSLFSGVGGIDLAMERAGIPTVAACEIDKSARGVIVRVDLPADGGRSPNAYDPHVTVEIRVFWPPLATGAQIADAIAEAAGEALATTDRVRLVKVGL